MANVTSKKYETSDELSAFLSSCREWGCHKGSADSVTRGDVIKAIWAYAEDEGLKTQKKYKGRNMGAIKTDAELKPIIGGGVKAAPEIMKNIGVHLHG